MKYIISILLIALLASCKTGKNAKLQDMNTLYKKWELSTIDGKKVNEVNPIYIQLKEDNNVSGYIGCNTVNGSYTINGKKIQFTQLATTRKACMDMNMEKNVLAVLDAASSFKLNDGKLILFVNGKEAATFSEMSEAEISNKYWKLLELNGKEVKMTDNQEREQFVMFTNEGTVSGFAGCNHFNGFYKLSEGKKITVDDKISSTLKTCPDVDVDESSYIKAIAGATSFKIIGEKMELFGKDEVKLAVFEVVYF
jgi:heat shock protein HslJ